MNIVGFVSLSPIHYGSCYSEFHQTSSRDAKTCLMLQPEPSCASRVNYPSHQPSPIETMVQNTDILLTPIFLVYPNQRNKSKGSCQMKNPIRVTMSSVGVSTSPHPPDLNDTALVKRITKERGWLLTACCSWLAPGQPLSSCLLFTTDMGISIFCPTKIKRRWFLITGDTIVMNLI